MTTTLPITCEVRQKLKSISHIKKFYNAEQFISFAISAHSLVGKDPIGIIGYIRQNYSKQLVAAEIVQLISCFIGQEYQFSQHAIFKCIVLVTDKEDVGPMSIKFPNASAASYCEKKSYQKEKEAFSGPNQTILCLKNPPNNTSYHDFINILHDSLKLPRFPHLQL